MKKIVWAVFSVLMLLILTSCGTSNSNTTTGSQEPDKGILTKIDLNDDGDAIFIIKNEGKDEAILSFTSGQSIEFQLLNEAKEVIYTYSANKLFMQKTLEKKLQPGEEWAIPLYLQAELAGVPAGAYTLMVWSTAEGLNDLKIETTYDWAGIATSESTGKLVVETQEVTYIGQQDLHSIEVKNLEGTTEVMRLSEVAIPFFDGLEEGTKLIVEYVVENEQKVIQFASLAE
ncbi:BsuPI-related putative proteinase inhibitor [Psychrobacillus sp. FSL H8-0483]|uniref:BsuPI-related putative proteinase inhibitor n=1 Tax=Psychrobacillus sp. FSL H8-0483 TaxID=2921389 RepID=UPI00315B2BD1